MDNKENVGVLNSLGICGDFNEDYCRFHISNLIVEKESVPAVIISSEGHKENNYLSSIISMPSFISLRNFIDFSSIDDSMKFYDGKIHKMMNSVFSFFDNEPILGFCDQYLPKSNCLLSNLVFSRGNDFLSVDIDLGDMLCFSLISGMPIYVRKEVIDKNGKEYEKSIEPLSIKDI